MGEVGRDLRIHLAQPLLHWGHPEQDAQRCVQVALKDLQGGDPTASMDNAREDFRTSSKRLKNHLCAIHGEASVSGACCPK